MTENELLNSLMLVTDYFELHYENLKRNSPDKAEEYSGYADSCYYLENALRKIIDEKKGE